MADTMMMDDAKRASLEYRIMEKLGSVDEGTLHNLDAWLSAPEQGTAPRRAMSRRQFLVAALVGGTAIAGAGGGGALLVRGREAVGTVAETAQGVGDIGDTIAQWQSYAEGLGDQLTDAGGVLNLYDQMDRIGLDDAVSRGMAAISSIFARGSQIAATLREGLGGAKARVNEFDEGLAVIDGGLARTEETISRVSGLFQALEDRLKDASQPVRPVTDALGGFFTSLLSKIPFGVGDSILETISRLQALVGAIPESIENINADLIAPLRERFFPRDTSGAVEVRLLEPLTQLLFLPAESVLTLLDELGSTWSNALAQPAAERIEARERIRQEIAKRRAEMAPLPGGPTE